MPLYLCRWPSGDFSVVKARTKGEAVELLDEVANAEGCPITVLDDFMAHFQLTKDGEFEFEEFGEVTETAIREGAYPVLDNALMREAPVNNKGDYTKEGWAVIRAAVQKEQERVKAGKGKEPETSRGREIKATTDMPTRKLDRIVRQASADFLKEFKAKGKVQ